MRYVKAADVKRELHITPGTLKRWKDAGKIKYKKLSDKKYLYDIDSITDTDESVSFNQKNVIYARVSTSGQRNDLDTQIDVIKNFMLSNSIKPDAVYKDIASGMNESRKSFRDLLDSVFKREVKCVFVSFKDRLTRFGFEYFKNIFEYFGTNIFVLDETNETPKSYQQEMCEDLMAIIHAYSMRLYNHKNNKLKKIESIILENEDEQEN